MLQIIIILVINTWICLQGECRHLQGRGQVLDRLEQLKAQFRPQHIFFPPMPDMQVFFSRQGGPGIFNPRQIDNGIFGTRQVNNAGIFGPRQIDNAGIFGPRQVDNAGRFGPRQIDNAGIFGPRQVDNAGIFGPRQINNAGIFRPRQINDAGMFGSRPGLGMYFPHFSILKLQQAAAGAAGPRNTYDNRLLEPRNMASFNLGPAFKGFDFDPSSGETGAVAVAGVVDEPDNSNTRSLENQPPGNPTSTWWG